jgi:hypothetical protein
MNLEQYKKKMNCVKTKFEHLGQQLVRKVKFDWYVDWKRGVTLCVADVGTEDEKICHMFEYMAGCNPQFSSKTVDDYTTEVKRLDSWKI